jgi:ATP-dependent DNA ligase
VAFDLLALGGDDQRRRTYSTRRQLLERLAASWAPPLQLCPSTTSRDEALKWAEDYRAAGVEGLVIKRLHRDTPPAGATGSRSRTASHGR